MARSRRQRQLTSLVSQIRESLRQNHSVTATAAGAGIRARVRAANESQLLTFVDFTQPEEVLV